MAPEQITRTAVGPAADWYAVGLMLHECLAGDVPFRGGIHAVLDAKVSRGAPPVLTVSPGAPADLATLCDGLLQRRAEARPSGVDVLARLGCRRAEARVVPGVFVGRSPELAVLREALVEARRTPAFVLVHGESGIGKSALVHAFLAEIGTHALVLQGRCYEREHVSYKAFDAAIDALARVLRGRDELEVDALLPPDTSPLAQMFPVLRTVPSIARGVASPAEAGRGRDPRDRAADALRSLLGSLATERPLVLVVDDLQWADAESFTLLDAVFRVEGAPPVLWVATVRGAPQDFAPIARWLDVARALPLAPLSASDALALAQRLGTVHGEADLALVARESGGHPLFLEELSHYAESVGKLRAGVRLDDALAERVRRLDAPTRRALEVLAVADAPIAQWIAAGAAGLGEATRSPEVAALRAAHLARTTGPEARDTIEPYHARVAEAVRALLDPGTRRAHHLSLAETVERSSASDEMEGFLLRHLEAGGENQRAGIQARRAAVRAASAFAFDRAANLYGTALRLGHFPEGEVVELHGAMGDALGRCGRGPEAADAFLRVADKKTGKGRVDAQRRAAQHLLGCGQIGRGLDVLRTLSKDVGVRVPESELEGTASLIWHRLKIAALGDRRTLRDERDVDPAVLQRIDLYYAAGAGLSHAGLVRGEDLQARGLYLALRTGEKKRVARGLLLDSLFNASNERGRPRGRALLAEAARIADETNDEYLRALVAYTRQFHAFLSGRFKECNDHGAVADDRLVRGSFDPWILNMSRIVDLSASMQWRGELRGARARIDGYLKDAARRDDRSFDTVRSVGALAWLAADQPEALLESLDNRTWTSTGVSPRTIRRYGTWPLLFELEARAQLALYTDDPPAFGRLLEGFAEAEKSILMRVVQVSRARVQWLRGLTALAFARHPGREACSAVAEAAAERQARERTPYGAAIAGLLRAGIASVSGDRDGARAVLEAAVPLAERAEMALAASAARYRLGQWTDGERGAALAAEGERQMREQGIVDLERVSRVLVPA
jgi:hypothetical protein